jgi:hypothetical protein
LDDFSRVEEKAFPIPPADSQGIIYRFLQTLGVEKGSVFFVTSHDVSLQPIAQEIHDLDG